MAMAIDPDFLVYSFSTTSSQTTNTCTSTEDVQACSWNNWSSTFKWEEIHGDQEELYNKIYSKIDENVIPLDQPIRPVYDEHNNLSPDSMITDEERNSTEDCKGLRLIHLLMAAAEAVTGDDQRQGLAKVILVRLEELVSPNDSTTMERLAAYFAEGLLDLLYGHSPGRQVPGINHYYKNENYNQLDILAAFQMLQNMSPYVKFGHFTANQAILEAVVHDKRIHILDYEIMEGIQWASLMQALVSRKGGLPTTHLRITAICRTGSCQGSIISVRETGRRLTAFAESIGLPFSFHRCRLNFNEPLRPSALKLARGETLVLNCMLHLSYYNHHASSSIASFLAMSKTLNPRIITLVERERATSNDLGFTGQFMDLLHHYAAMHDSLEAGFPLNSQAQELVERIFLRPQINGSLALIFSARQEEKEYSWETWLAKVGFRRVSISSANQCQARLLSGLYNDGYRIEEATTNKLALCWKSRRLLSASIWGSQDIDE